ADYTRETAIERLIGLVPVSCPGQSIWSITPFPGALGQNSGPDSGHIKTVSVRRMSWGLLPRWAGSCPTHFPLCISKPFKPAMLTAIGTAIISRISPSTTHDQGLPKFNV